MTPRGWVAALALLAPTVAMAWPVDRYVELRAGEKRTEELAKLDWVEVEGGQVLSARLADKPGPDGTRALTLEAHARGRAKLLLYAEGRFAVWSIVVDAGAPDAAKAERDRALALAKAACPDLKAEPSHLAATVNSEACRLALKGVLQTDAYRAADLELTFSVPMLQAQLKDIQRALSSVASQVTAQYSGAGLVLKGEATPDQARAALWGVFRAAVGRVALEDRLQMKASEP